MNNDIKIITDLVVEGIKTGNYRKIIEALNYANSKNIFVAEDDKYIAIEDEVYYIPENTF